jgi:starvation-inducible DNA-binding protein
MATTKRRSTGKKTDSRRQTTDSQPLLHQGGTIVQDFDELRDLPLALDPEVRREMADALNPILADTQILASLYKKTHWLMRGATFYQLHLLMDKHAGEQLALIDSIAERIQTLGAIAVGDPRHAAELTTIPRPPDGAEEVPAMLSRILEAHETIVAKARDLAGHADDAEDYATNDLLGSEVLPVNEMQVWFVAEHLVDTPLVRA